MYTFYVLQNHQGKIYKGYTNDLSRRLVEHNNKYRKSYASKRGPWKLVYQEVFKDKTEVIKRERYFKSGRGREELKRILNNEQNVFVMTGRYPPEAEKD